MDPAAATASMDFVNYEDEDWELRHDEDGFTYKILKRQHLLNPEQIPLSDPKAEEKHRKQQRKKILLKLKLNTKTRFVIGSFCRTTCVQWKLKLISGLNLRTNAKIWAKRRRLRP